MKIIHCADIHLDSKLSANLDREKAKLRKDELLNTFCDMVEYAKANGVTAILIAGDMFDTKNISATTRNTVLHLVNKNSDINFYYLKGNHDIDNFLSGIDEVPDNLKLFNSKWTRYEEASGLISINGIELSKDNQGSYEHTLILDNSVFNIVMLHGQENEGSSKDKAEIINLKALRNKGIDYLALGHIHSYKKEMLDSRGFYCYPGCLEGRGFDECGEHGFVLIDVDESKRTYTHTFIPFAKRKLYEVEVDATDLTNSASIIEKAKDALNKLSIPMESMVKFIIRGEVDVECEKDISAINAAFSNSFYFTKVYDETRLKIDPQSYKLDASLKGEFIRTVMEDESLSYEDKTEIIRYGLLAIAREEID